MASRAEQKAAARAAREQAAAQIHASRRQRTQLMAAGGVLLAVVAAAAVVIALSSGGGGTTGTFKANKKTVPNPVPGAVMPMTPAAAVADVHKQLDGIPESGNTLGKANAPVTVTEFGDLVCSTCDDFALTSEKQLITADVRTGKVKLVYRGLATASNYANSSQYIDTQVAARSAGLQGKEWYYVLLTYDLQPETINGTDSEELPYVTSAYLQNRASLVPGINLLQWQTNMTNPTLIAAVHADTSAANAAGVSGTPAVFVSGPKGTVQYDRGNSPSLSAVPSLAQLQALIAQVS
ncbi:MAG: thioredoxin domain-containing protein [Solirubrobacteraceae bacterium]